MKTYPQEGLAGIRKISSCNADTRTSKQVGSPPIGDSAAQVPPGGDKQYVNNRKRAGHLLEEVSKKSPTSWIFNPHSHVNYSRLREGRGAWLW